MAADPAQSLAFELAKAFQYPLSLPQELTYRMRFKSIPPTRLMVHMEDCAEPHPPFRRHPERFPAPSLAAQRCCAEKPCPSIPCWQTCFGIYCSACACDQRIPIFDHRARPHGGGGSSAIQVKEHSDENAECESTVQLL